MSYNNVFDLVADTFKQSNTAGILIGGFAINYHKVTRQTVDVDFLITKDNYEKIIDALLAAGYRKDRVGEVFVRLTSNELQFMDLDFMFVDEETFSKVLKDGIRIKISDYEFIVPSLMHLIALKLHAIKCNPQLRTIKDLPDIISLIKINKVDPTAKEFKEICLRYGTEDIYGKIIGNV